VKFAHTLRIEASKAKVDAFLGDFERSALCLPGVEEVRSLGDGEYEGRVRVRVGPLGFNLGGRARPERGADGRWLVHGEGNDRRIGAGVKASLEAQLTALGPDTTDVQISADVQFSGRLAGLGQPLIKRKADAMVLEFTENLRQAVAAS